MKAIIIVAILAVLGTMMSFKTVNNTKSVKTRTEQPISTVTVD